MNKYVASVYNRHWNMRKEKVGVEARTLEAAVTHLNNEKGKVISIREVKEFPRHLDSKLTVW